MKKIKDKIWIGTRRLQLEVTRSTYQSIPYLLSGLVSAVVCSAYTVLFQGAEKLSQEIFKENELLVFALVPPCFVAAWLLVRLFAQGAAGSGIPQVMAGLDDRGGKESFLRGLFSLRVLSVKILSSSLLVLGGGAVGREGPSIQISAAIFYKIRQVWNSFGNSLSLKNMLIAGGAGGIAAAFNTPLGGVIYAVEELTRDHVSNFRIGLLEAVITAGLVAQLINGPYLFLGFPVLPGFKLKTLLVVFLIAALSGLGGAAFGRLIFWGLNARKNMSAKSTFAFVVFLSFVVASMIYFVGIEVMGSGKLLITDILFRGREVSLAEVLGRFWGPFFAILTGASGGIFAPALSAGAALGELLSQIMSSTLANLAPVCGMIGFLTGVTRTPVTAFVLMLEMTDRHSAIFPMMFSALIAHIFARVVDKQSFYEKMALVYVKEAQSHEPVS